MNLNKIIRLAIPVMLLLTLVAWDVFLTSGDAIAGGVAFCGTLITLILIKEKKIVI